MSTGLAAITIMGTVGKDAQTRQAGSSSVTGFSVAVNSRKGREETTDWFECSIWGTRGEKLASHITKGSKVAVSGGFTTRKYESGGETRTSLEINVSDFSFAGGGQKREDGDDYAPPAGGGGGFGGDDIPF